MPSNRKGYAVSQLCIMFVFWFMKPCIVFFYWWNGNFIGLHVSSPHDLWNAWNYINFTEQYKNNMNIVIVTQYRVNESHNHWTWSSNPKYSPILTFLFSFICKVTYWPHTFNSIWCVVHHMCHLEVNAFALVAALSESLVGLSRDDPGNSHENVTNGRV